ncbi:MAG: hypothetical protein ACRD04_09785 [Terriglobales bacterium]
MLMLFRLPLLLLALALTLPRLPLRPALSAQAAAPTPAAAQARRIVRQAIGALGGDMYLQAAERSGQGYYYTFSSAGEMNGAGNRFWSYYRFPADERLELTKKRNVIYIFAGGKGWQITFRGVAPMLRPALRNYVEESRHSLDVILKSWAANPQTLMLAQGQQSYDEAPVNAVLFTNPQGVSATVQFARDTHLPERVYWTRTDPDTGGRYVQSVVYGDWASIGGIEAAFSVDTYQGPQRLAQRYYTQISFAPFPDSLFIPKPLKK